MIAVHVSSRDQGWTSEGNQGTRLGHSWGEIVINNSLTREELVRCTCYKNIVAGTSYESQSVLYGRDSSLIQRLESIPRDQREFISLQLYIRSQYPGWNHRVESASFQITYQITDFSELFARYKYLST